MNSFEDLCTDMIEELGRQLKENEVEFLKWIYQRHLEELEIEKRSNQEKLV